MWYNKNRGENMINTEDSNLTYGRGYVYRIQYHIVWCTKYRKPVLTGEIETALKSEVSTISDDLGIEVNAVECMPDHIHLLVCCSPQHYIPTVIKILKGNSARHLFMDYPELKKDLWGGHLWNPSYFVATVSDNTTAQIEQYINSQKIR